MEIPVFKAQIKKSIDGINILSMVAEPAIEVNYIAMKEDSNKVKLAIVDNEQRIVFAPALIPDKPIYRNLDGKEFFIVFDKATIKECLLKLSVELKDNNVDINHSQDLISNVTVFEKFITDENRVVSVKGFEDMPLGTLFFTAQVNNPDVWEQIKLGKINGWSIDGLFDLQPETTLNDEELNAVLNNLI